MKKSNKKGFTLAELLIVVAIIAVLVAIAIPIFNSQLEKSRDSVSISNLRTAYAEAAAEFLTWDGGTYDQAPGSKVASIDPISNGFQITVEDVDIKSQNATPSWSNLANDLPFTAPADPGAPIDDGVATFDYNSNTGEWACTSIA